MKRSILAAAVLAGLAVAPAARAWEADTTNAGLTHQAAFAAGLHTWLVDAMGLDHGLYTRVRLPQAEAKTAYQGFDRLDPVLGSVPDGKGRMPALDWLVAGSILEEIPAARGRHHFAPGLKYSPGVARGMWWRVLGVSPPRSGTPAADWIVSKDNELGMTAFLDALEKAASSATAAERDAHLARALMAAGAMTAVLEDMGSPSRARGDFDAHLMRLGGGSFDRGSRLERLAALGYGRLDVPAPRRIETRTRARDFFTSENGQGLADVSRRWYSYGTLPEDERLPSGPLKPMTVAKQPLDLVRAQSSDGVELAAPDGTCLAVYRRRGRQLQWLLPDRCVRDQLAVILPETGAYAAGFLGWLFRGALVFGDGGVSLAAVDVTEGTLRWFSEDEAGTRAPVGSAITVGKVGHGAALGATPALPAGGKRLVAVFRGTDASGEPLVAVGTQGLPKAAPPEPEPTPEPEPEPELETPELEPPMPPTGPAPRRW